jgi:hypothetical protein
VELERELGLLRPFIEALDLVGGDRVQTDTLGQVAAALETRQVQEIGDDP